MGLFATRYGRTPLSVSPALVEACLNYRWPGNLRELENFVKRYLILGDESMVLHELESKPEDPSLPEEITATAPQPKDRPADLKSLVRSSKDEIECEAISRTLKQTKWNRKEAARLLNISYKALLYKIRQYNLDRV